MLSNIEKPERRAAQADLGAARRSGFSPGRQRGGNDFLLAPVCGPVIRRAFNHSLDRSIASEYRRETVVNSGRYATGRPTVTIVGQLLR
jgi:hypothetical protein